MSDKTQPNAADIDSRAAKLYSVWSKAFMDGLVEWGDLDNGEQDAWRAVAMWTLTNES